VKRGEVWWAALPTPAGRRPVVLLSRDEAYAVRELVTVAPVTQRIRDLPVEVTLGVEEGLPRSCVANLDTVTTIPKALLEEQLTTLSPAKMRDVERALCFALALDP
jgi:mRNA interferase MazF